MTGGGGGGDGWKDANDREADRLISMSKMKMTMMMVMGARMLMVHGNACGDDHDDCSDMDEDGNNVLLVTVVCYEACDGYQRRCYHCRVLFAICLSLGLLTL